MLLTETQHCGVMAQLVLVSEHKELKENLADKDKLILLLATITEDHPPEETATIEEDHPPEETPEGVSYNPDGLEFGVVGVATIEKHPEETPENVSYNPDGLEFGVVAHVFREELDSDFEYPLPSIAGRSNRPCMLPTIEEERRESDFETMSFPDGLDSDFEYPSAIVIFATD
eukprot:g15274.t1